MTENLPGGTFTFLFTDIEGSTRLWEKFPEAMKLALARHDTILREAIEARNGQVFKTVGDAFCAVFTSAPQAILAALIAQRMLQAEARRGDAEDGPIIKVRMGLHTGEVEMRDNDYFGPPLNRVARLMSAGHGGQVLLSAATHELIRRQLPHGAELRDMGEHNLKDLSEPEHIYQISITGLPTDFPPLKTLEVFRSNLPAQITSFIGREKEISEIKRLMAEHRLITLTGSGGTGKTRLSLQVTSNLLDSFVGGIWFVEFAPLSNPSLVPQTVCNTLGLREEPTRSALDVLTSYLREKKVLLILDNCEHLVEAAAQLTEALLRACPNLWLLTSSREALGIAGEKTFHVRSLSTPDAGLPQTVETVTQFEAVRLFIDRAQAVSTGFTVSAVNAAAIAQICTRLDGIPLAIELAAARVKMLKPEQIAERLNDRFHLLTGGSRTALPRQQTLRAMIDWSYDLLSTPERTLLRRLSVFAGGWTLEAAEEVCRDEIRSQKDEEKIFLHPSDFILHTFDVLDLLSQLVNKSLVVVDAEDSAETRYRLLETVRQYAREKLVESGEDEKARDQHLHAFIQLAEKAEPEIRGANQLLWLNRLDEEIDNLRAALEWVQERNAELFLRITSALWRFWSLREHIADAHWLPDALARTQDLQTVLRARALGRAVYNAKYYDDLQQPIAWAKEAETLSIALADKPGLSLAYLMQGDLETDPAQQLTLFDKALSLSKEIGATWLSGIIQTRRGFALLDQNDLKTARIFFEQGLKDLYKSGDRRAISFGLGGLGDVALKEGNALEAEKWFREAFIQADGINDETNASGYYWSIIMTKLLVEDYAGAKRIIQEGIAPNSQFYLAIVNLAQGNITGATEQIGAELLAVKQTKNLHDITYMTNWFANALRHSGDFTQAGMQYHEALNIAQKSNNRSSICDGLAEIAMLAIDQGKFTSGVCLLGAWETLRSAAYTIDFLPFMVRDREAHIATARAALDETTFAAAQAAGRAMSMDEAIALALESTQD